ncbi:hypothetical protein ABPG74_016240 [Tetrahymena malaccensis]
MDETNKKVTTSKPSNVIFNTQTRGYCPGYLSPHNQISKKGLIVLQEWWGMNESICLLADEFAHQGFKVLVPDLYRGKVAKSHEEAGHLLTGLDWKGAIEDIANALQYLIKLQGCTSVGITGFCMGGALTLASLSAIEGFSCGSPFYGICDQQTFPVTNIRVPVLAHFGEDDDLVGFSDVQSAKALKLKAHEASVDFRLRTYPQAGHAFMRKESKTYQPQAAAAAFKETVEFFQQQLK